MAEKTGGTKGWASDVGASVTEPSDSLKNSGYSPTDVPAVSHFNWLMARTLPVYNAPREAIDELGTDAILLLDKGLNNQRRGTVQVETNVGVDIGHVTTDGHSLFMVLEGNTSAQPVWRFLTDALVDGGVSTASQTYTVSNPGAYPYNAIATNGQYVAVAYSTYVDWWDIASGTLIATYNHTAEVYDICMDATRLFIGGKASPGYAVSAFLLATGANLFQYGHDNTVFSIDTNGEVVVFAGEAHTSGSGATVRCITTSGADASNEGGTSQDSTGRAWDVAQADIVSRRGNVKIDFERVVIGFDENQTVSMQVRDIGAGNLLQTHIFQISVAAYYRVQQVDLDDRNIYVALYDPTGLVGYVYALEKTTGGRIWRGQVTNNEIIYCLVTDGIDLYCGHASGAAGEFTKLYQGYSGPRLYRRVDPFSAVRLPKRVFLQPSQ